MLKHVGRHGDRKVAIVFREIPGDEHMCLVIYPDVLPTHIHNSIMSVLESAPGQQATNLADVFHRNLLSDLTREARLQIFLNRLLAALPRAHRHNLEAAERAVGRTPEAKNRKAFLVLGDLFVDFQGLGHKALGVINRRGFRPARGHQQNALILVGCEFVLAGEIQRKHAEQD